MHSFEVHSNESKCRKSGRLGLEQVVDITCENHVRKLAKKIQNNKKQHSLFSSIYYKILSLPIPVLYNSSSTPISVPYFDRTLLSTSTVSSTNISLISSSSLPSSYSSYVSTISSLPFLTPPKDF